MNPSESTPSGEEPLRLTKHSDPAPRPESGPDMRTTGPPRPPVVMPRRAPVGGSPITNSFSMEDFKQAPVEHSAPEPEPAPEPAPPKLAVVEGQKPRGDGEYRAPRDPRTRPMLFGPEPVVMPKSRWEPVFDVLRTRPQWVVLGIVVILTAIFMIPRSKEDSISKIQKHSAEYDGQTVKVRGRVGEMFEIAGGHVYYLHQGRDTIVVFTRATPPDAKKDVVVTATVSTGYMDGRPRLALFEN